MKDDPRVLNEYPEIPGVQNFLVEYSQKIADVFRQLGRDEFQKALTLLEKTVERGGRVYVAGNGGSASISDHLCCDWMKGTYFHELPSVRTHALSSSTGLVTAIANDFGYEFIFERQLEMLLEKRDLVLLISSSGNSPNILRAAQYALSQGVEVIGMTGFSGGTLKEMVTVSLHIPLKNYGMVEDSHQMIMHSLGQILIQKRTQLCERK